MKDLPITSIKLAKAPELSDELIMLRLKYWEKYRSAPEAFLVNPQHYAQLQFNIWGTVTSEPLIYQDCKVIIKPSGPPECAIAPRHFKQALWEQHKEQAHDQAPKEGE